MRGKAPCKMGVTQTSFKQMLDCHTASFRLLCILIQYMTLILNNCIIFIEFKKQFGNTPLCQRSCALLRNWQGVLHACISSSNIKDVSLRPERDYGSTSIHNHIYLLTVQLTYNLIKYYYYVNPVPS